MPRKKAPLATTFAEKKAKAFRVKQAKARSLVAKAARDANRAKRMIGSGMLISAPSTTTTTRRTKKAGAVSVKVRKSGVSRGCSTAGRELVTRKTSRAGRYLVTKCKTGKSATATTTTRKRKSSPKSAVKKVRVGAGASVPNPLKAVSKVVKSILGGGTKKRSTTTRKTTTKKVSRSRSSSSKLARIKRIVC